MIANLAKLLFVNCFRVLGICLGVPSNEFVWEFYDKSKAYHKIGPITPLQFYKEHVKPHFDMMSKVIFSFFLSFFLFILISLRL